MDGFFSLTPQTLQTPEGVARLNNMLQALFNSSPGDGVAISDFTGYGTPEGSLAAGIGATYRRIDGSTDTTFYRKESGSGNTGWVAVKAPPALPLSTVNGGTGVDSSAWTSGDAVYMSGVGTWSHKAFPTDTNTSNALFQYAGQVDNQGANIGEYVGTLLNPLGVTGNYRYLQSNGSVYQQVWSAKFIKISGINTVTVKARIWGRINANNANMQVSVGGQVGNAAAGINTAGTPTWVSFTIDVSSLTNGTTYDVLASLKDQANADIAYCANIQGFGS